MNIFKLIPLLFNLKKEVGKMKTGFLTSEFWMSAITVIGLLLGAFLDKIPMGTITMIVPIITGLYIIARSIVKSTASTADDEILAKIEEAILKKLPGYTTPNKD